MCKDVYRGAEMETKLKSLLYDCIVELSYVQDAEDHSQCASAKGRHLVNLGMELLGVKDLAEETYANVLKAKAESL
jgi:hypothetical protein